ncbi:hypothetical protein ACLBKS_04835 [Hylemonella sp. W303a]|uniref:hypothetical protein n=1 Tax=Hylemonella sp. W303a TaxID=3389873 RepID=UPI00396B025B
MTWHIYILVALISVLGAFSVQRYVAFRNAAAKFRSSVLTALLGIYPPTERWKEDVSTSLVATLPAVKSACVEFHPNVSRFKRKAFAKACAEYEEHCRQKDPFTFLLAHALDPATFPENPQTIFCRHVELLLSFAHDA